MEPLDGYEVSDINMSTVKLNRMLFPERWKVQDGKLVMKFKAEDVIGLIWAETYHMGKPMPQENVTMELPVSGELYGGATFEGSDEIRLIASSL